MPAATGKVATTDTVKMLLRNSAGVMIGSATRVSTTTKTASMTTATMSSPMICAEPQAYCVPAQEKASSSGTAPAAA